MGWERGVFGRVFRGAHSELRPRASQVQRRGRVCTKCSEQRKCTGQDLNEKKKKKKTGHVGGSKSASVRPEHRVWEGD